jgi:ABC-type Zn uptake system ZnuABC Zn-binding protein ZnuA
MIIKKQVAILRLLLLVVVLISSGCNKNSSPYTYDNQKLVDMVIPEIEPVKLDDGEHLAVVATTSIVGDVVENIGGDSIQLIVLMGVGQDPHSYEPTPKDLAAVEKADIIFINGLDLEEVLSEIIRDIATGAIVPVSAGITPLEGISTSNDSDAHPQNINDDIHKRDWDPHFWSDPNNVIVWVENIKMVLMKADPASKDIYTANAVKYQDDLKAIDSYIREETDLIPENKRKLITDHDMLGYFAKQYGYKLVGAVIPSTSNIPGASAGMIANLVAIINSENVPVVFIGSTASQGIKNLAKALADEADMEIKIVPILTGSLANKGEPGDTYIGYMRYNIDQIVSGLTQ